MSHPDPGKLLASLSLYQLPMALKGALDLNLFTHINAGANTPAPLAEKCQASERGVRILCDYLTIMGFLQKSNGAYALTPETGIFLDANSPAYLGSIAGFLTHPIMRANFDDVAAIVLCRAALRVGNARCDQCVPIRAPHFGLRTLVI